MKPPEALPHREASRLRTRIVPLFVLAQLLVLAAPPSAAVESTCDPGTRACVHEDAFDPAACTDSGYDGGFTSTSLVTNGGSAGAGGVRWCAKDGARSASGSAIAGGAGTSTGGAYASWIDAQESVGDGPTSSTREIQAYAFTTGSAPHARVGLYWREGPGPCTTDAELEAGDGRAAPPLGCPVGGPPAGLPVGWGDLLP